MQLYPAIDLKDGKCVRLVHGDMEQSTVFNDSAGNQAKQFNDAGCDWLHCVDLNGAFAGESVNTDAVMDILANTNAKVQLGGGIRTIEHIENWINAGISRVILGTVAVNNPDLVIEACKKFPNKVAVGIDAKDGFVAVEGWAETTSTTVIELAKKFEDVGVSAIIYTDINRDGAMGGVNVDTTAELARAVNIPIIASGGVASVDDIRKLKATNSGIHGVISGRALYDGAIDLGDALKVCKE
ncbi:MAG: 1-(5-phosphoribosyl)-5-[(5-phosphoribosylamino)methylideneamino]imidazole-4-carboxamide isomerase [Alphaproteobacteria bacterium]